MAESSATPSRALPIRLVLPMFPDIMMNEHWRFNNRVEKKKIHQCALSIRCTLAAMCGMHMHQNPQARSFDIHDICEHKYHELVQSLLTKCPNAKVCEFLTFTTLEKTKKMGGKNVWRMSQQVKKEICNRYNPMWQSCLSNDIPPSGRQWEWVRQRVLVLLWRALKKNTDPLPSNQGFHSFT